MSLDRSLRVAFAAGHWTAWIGGINYYRNLLGTVASHPDVCLEPILYMGTRADDLALDGFPRVQVVRSRIFDRPSPAWAVRAIGRRAFRRDFEFERMLRADGVVALSHSTQLWRSNRIAMLGWIADFQHLLLPEFFPAPERRRRDSVFARICALSTLIIVSSEACRRQLASFAPERASKARVLRFVSEPLPRASSAPPGGVASRYGIQPPYFHLPNQFWAHKNHALVIEALDILRDRGIVPLVVATGATTDYRRPGHFEALMNRARELGVDRQFRVLGIVSYVDASALMRGALAVINPSRYEGWSTTVEESKSLGKRVLLSDIEVHREQDPPGGVFFDPDDAEGLADAMALLWQQGDETRDVHELRRAASAALPDRRLEFARTYEAIVREAVALVSS